jgi:hypothetical protein
MILQKSGVRYSALDRPPDGERAERILARHADESIRASATQPPSTRTRTVTTWHARRCCTEDTAARCLTHAAFSAGSSGLDPTTLTLYHQKPLLSNQIGNSWRNAGRNCTPRNCWTKSALPSASRAVAERCKHYSAASTPMQALSAQLILYRNDGSHPRLH